MVKQTYVDGIFCIITGIIAISCGIVAYKLDMKGKLLHNQHNKAIVDSEEYKKLMTKELDSSYFSARDINRMKESLGFKFEEQFSVERYASILLFSAMFLLSSIYFLCNLKYAISCLTNPEYQAIIQLLHAIK